MRPFIMLSACAVFAAAAPASRPVAGLSDSGGSKRETPRASPIWTGLRQRPPMDIPTFPAFGCLRARAATQAADALAQPVVLRP